MEILVNLIMEPLLSLPHYLKMLLIILVIVGSNLLVLANEHAKLLEIGLMKFPNVNVSS